MTNEKKIEVKTPTTNESNSKKKLYIILTAFFFSIVAIGSLTLAPTDEAPKQTQKNKFIDLTPGDNKDWRTEMQMQYKAILNVNSTVADEAKRSRELAEQTLALYKEQKVELENIKDEVKKAQTAKPNTGPAVYISDNTDSEQPKANQPSNSDSIQERIRKQLEQQTGTASAIPQQPIADKILPPPPGMAYGKAKELGETSNIEELTRLKPSTKPDDQQLIFHAREENYIDDTVGIDTETVYVENEFAGFITPGAFAKVALLSGLDSGTSEYTRANPQPVLMRIQTNAQLPQGKYAIKSCFALGSSYGDLSSERIFIQPSRISCIDNANGMMLTGTISGYVTDSDSIQGLKGNVIRRNGQLIGKSMLAGFASGLSSVAATAGTSQVTTVTGAINTSLDTDKVLETGGMEGISSTMETIAKQYMDEAKNMFPVISVSGGRVGTMILTQGTKLEWKSYRGKYEQKVTPQTLDKKLF